MVIDTIFLETANYHMLTKMLNFKSIFANEIHQLLLPFEFQDKGI